MMDKNEAVQKLARQALISTAHAEDLYDSFFEKPVVPQYVAAWYEGNKRNLDLNLSGLVFDLATNSPIYHQEEFKAWVEDNKKTFITTLVNMHQFGYEVEEETRYQVTFKDLASNFRVLKYHLQLKNWFAGNDSKYDHTRMYHTRKELEDADLAWVFDCEGIEIEEVE